MPRVETRRLGRRRRRHIFRCCWVHRRCTVCLRSCLHPQRRDWRRHHGRRCARCIEAHRAAVMQASIGGTLAAWERVEEAASVTHPRRGMWVKQRHCILRRCRRQVGRWHGRSRRRRRRCRSLRRIYVGNTRSRCSWWGRRSLAVRRHGCRGRHGCCRVHRRRRGARHAKLRHCRRGSGRITGRCPAHPVRHRLPIRRRLAERRKEGIHVLLCTYSVASTSFVSWYVLRGHAAMRHGHRRAGRGEEHGCAGREKHASLPHWGAAMEVCSFQRAARTGVQGGRRSNTR